MRLAAAAAPVFDRVVAVERPGGEKHSIPTIHETPHDGAAPLFGLVRALHDASGRCFVVATDFALMTTDVFRFFRSRLEKTNASMLVPRWGGMPQILCAGYMRCVLPLAEARIAGGHFDIRGLLDETEVEWIEESEIRQQFSGEPLLNVNTPADLAVAETYL